MICRLCLIDLNSKKSVLLFNEFGSNDEQQLVKIILKYLHLDITWSDEISTSICNECSKHLNEFDKYCTYVRKQQTILSQRILLGQQNAVKDVEAAPSVEEPMEVQVKSESEEDATMETQFKCEPEEAVLNEMALLSNAGTKHSTSSSYTKPSSSSIFHQIKINDSTQISKQSHSNAANSSTGCIYISEKDTISLPDANTIRLLPPLQKIFKRYSKGNRLENKDRVQIAKAVIDEYLKDIPGKLLHREEFEKLAENIKEVFPTEFVSMYYIRSMRDKQASGKLYNAYNNKKTALRESGELNGRFKTIAETYVTPDASQIKLLRPLQQIYKKYQLGKSLQNKDRIVIAKAVIDSCLEENPDKILKRFDFLKLTANIIEVFPTETEEAYFIPSIKSITARGKLWSAYNNKRNAFRQDGLIKRRLRLTCKGESLSPSFSTETSLNMLNVEDIPETQLLEYIQYLEQNTSDWENILSKWTQTHIFRNRKLKTSMSTCDYIAKFPALQSDRGIELVSIDVKMLYPAVAPIENWLNLYEKLLNRARSVRNNMVSQLIAEIDASSNERFKAGLTLICIPYIFPHAGKRCENGAKRATKSDIQQRFIKEYNSISELNAEEQIEDLQIKFVREEDSITYAEFCIAGYKFKCLDLIEALNLGFMYITALNVAYPQLCIQVWQFIQLAIFKIDLSYIKVSSVETIVNDIFKEV